MSELAREKERGRGEEGEREKRREREREKRTVDDKCKTEMKVEGFHKINTRYVSEVYIRAPRATSIKQFVKQRFSTFFSQRFLLELKKNA